MTDYNYINEISAASLADLTDDSVFEVEKRTPDGRYESRSLKLLQLRLIATEPLEGHAQVTGKAGHVPVTGIGDNEVDSIGIAKIQGLSTRLAQIEDAIGSGGGYDSFSFTLRDFSDPTYYYYGGQNLSGEWRVNRWAKDGLVKQYAIPSDNLSYTTLDEAWVQRSILVYVGQVVQPPARLSVGDGLLDLGDGSFLLLSGSPSPSPSVVYLSTGEGRLDLGDGSFLVISGEQVTSNRLAIGDGGLLNLGDGSFLVVD